MLDTACVTYMTYVHVYMMTVTVLPPDKTETSTSQTLISCFITLYLFCNIRPKLLLRHATTLHPYLSSSCAVSCFIYSILTLYISHALYVCVSLNHVYMGTYMHTFINDLFRAHILNTYNVSFSPGPERRNVSALCCQDLKGCSATDRTSQ